jgi:Fanconi anemia group I protein
LGKKLCLTCLSTFREFQNVDLQELPPLAYHLLLLTSAGCKDIVLRGLIEHFNALEKKFGPKERSSRFVSSVYLYSFYSQQHSQTNIRQLRQIEGTIILHVEFAAKQDQALGKELLKIFSQDPDPWKPFNWGLLLCLSRISRFEAKVLAQLKKSVLSCFKNTSKENFSLEGIVIRSQLQALEKAVITTVHCSVQGGWDFISQPFLNFGFLLMDCTITKTDPNTVKVVKFGQKVLMELFQFYELARSPLLDNILAHILMKHDNIQHYVFLLSQIIKENPQLLLERTERVSVSLDRQ